MIRKIIKKLYFNNSFIRMIIKYILKKINSDYKKNISNDVYNLKFNNINPKIYNKLLFVDYYFSCKKIYESIDKKYYDVINLNNFKYPFNDEYVLSKILNYKNIIVAEEIFELVKYKNNHNIICIWHGESLVFKNACALFIKNYIPPFNKVIVGNRDIELSKKMFKLNENDILCFGDVHLEEISKNNVSISKEEIYKKYGISKKVNKIYYIAFSFEEKPFYVANIFYDFKKIEKFLDDNEVIIYNIHPNIIRDKPNDEYYSSSKIIYVKNLDRCELLPYINLFVTDYSSCISEAILLNKPCLVLIENYINYDRGFIYKKKEFPLNLLISKNPKKIVKSFRRISNENPNYNHLYENLVFKNAKKNITKYLLKILKK